jgi:hypothetical protein
VSTSTLRGHVNTMPNQISEGRRRRRTHSSEFKAQVIAACNHPGISVAAVATANGINANLAPRWVMEAERAPTLFVALSAAPTLCFDPFNEELPCCTDLRWDEPPDRRFARRRCWANCVFR